MKNVMDATLLRNRMVALLEEAALEKNEAARRELLTFVTAGGGFAGAETTGAVNDFLAKRRGFIRRYAKNMIRVVVIHPGPYLLPELGEEFGRYAERKLSRAQSRSDQRREVASYDGSVVKLNDGRSIPAATLIWTAGVKPSPVIASLAVRKRTGASSRKRNTSPFQESTGLWAVGDCAAVPDSTDRANFIRQRRNTGCGKASGRAKNIEAQILGQPLKPFRFHNSWTTGDYWPAHRCRYGIWNEVFGIHRLVDVAIDLSDEAAASCQEAASS